MTTTLHDQASLPQPEPHQPRKPWYLRSAVLLPLVVVAAVVATVLVVTRGDRTVEGTAQAPAATSVQLHATVTSALTGEPLAAVITLSDGTSVPVAANGAVVTDRVEPGDGVVISAKGYLEAQATVGADRMITVTLNPTLATVTTQLNTWAEEKNADAITNWVFSPATGLQFTPSTTVEQEGDIPWWAAFDVVGRNTTVDATLIPGIIGERETVESMFDGNGTQVILAGQPAWHGPVTDGIFASIWMRSPLMITATSTELSTTDEILAAMIAAQPSR